MKDTMKVDGTKTLASLCLEYALADHELWKLVKGDRLVDGRKVNPLIDRRIKAEQDLLREMLKNIGYELKIHAHTWEVVKKRR